MKQARPLLVLMFLMLCASRAEAEWWVQSPDDSCIERSVLVALVVEAVPAEALSSGPRRTARIALDPEEGLVSILVAREGVMLGERRLRVGSNDCRELAEAAAFVVATLIEGGVGLLATTETLPQSEGATQLAPPASAQNEDAPESATLESGLDITARVNTLESDAGGAADAIEVASDVGARDETHDDGVACEECDSSEERVDVFHEPQTREVILAGGALLRSGVEPNVGVSPRISLSLRIGRLRFSLHGAYVHSDVAVETRRLVIDSGEVGARFCVGHLQLRTWRLEGCAGVDLGIHAGKGEGFDENGSARLTSLGIVAEVGVRYTYRRLIIRGSVGGAGRVQHVRFTREAGGEAIDVFRQANASFLAFVELGVRFDWSRM